MKYRTQDKGWAWVVLFACFCTNFLSVGILRSSGVLFLALRTNFETTRQEAAWPLTIRKIVGAFAGLLIGFMIHFVSLKKLVFLGIIFGVIGLGGCFFANNILTVSVLFGVSLGLGSGMVSSSNIVMVNRYFSRYRTVALGILYSGTASGGFVYPIAASYLLDTYNLQGCFLLMSGILLQSSVAATLYRKPPPLLEKSVKSSESHQPNGVCENKCPERTNKTRKVVKSPFPVTLKEKFKIILQSLFLLIRSFMFHTIWMTSAIYSVTFVIYLTVIVDYSVDCGIEKHKGVFILSSMSITEFCSRLSCGWIIDMGWLKRKNVIRIASVIFSVLLFIIPVSSTYTGLICITLCIGFVSSCLSVNISALYNDYLGLDNLPLAVGSGRALVGVVHFGTPRIVGYFRDVHGSYSSMFYYFGGAVMVAFTLWLLEPLTLKIQPKERTTNNNEV